MKKNSKTASTSVSSTASSTAPTASPPATSSVVAAAATSPPATVTAPVPPAAPPAASLPTTKHANKGDIEALLETFISGLTLLYLPTDTFLLEQTTYLRDDLIAKAQAAIDAMKATKTAYLAYRDAVDGERTAVTPVLQLRAGVRGMAQSRFGVGSLQLLKLGFTPRKPPVVSSETRIEAKAKAAATRAARHTMGKKQKQAITGTVTPVTNGAIAPAPVAASTTVASPAPAAVPAAVAVSPAAPQPTAPTTAATSHS